MRERKRYLRIDSTLHRTLRRNGKLQASHAFIANPTIAASPARTTLNVAGSGTLVTAIIAKSVFASRDKPDEGKSTALIDGEGAVKVLPSDRSIWGVLRVAEKMAEEKRTVSGNCKGPVKPKGPGAISPKSIV